MSDLKKRLQKLSDKVKPEFIQVSGLEILKTFKRVGIDATGHYKLIRRKTPSELSICKRKRSVI